MREEGAGRFRLAWPEGLSIYDMNRLMRAKVTCSIPSELGRLAGKQVPVQMTAEEAYTLIADINALWKFLGFYPFDPDRTPAEWTEGDESLPACVLATSESMYVDINDMNAIVALYQGKNLPDYLPEGERQARLRRQQRRLVMTTQCREPGCEEMVAITVGMAGRAIVEHKLREKGDVYEPSTLCKTHRLARDAKLAEKRANGGRLSAPIGEQIGAKPRAPRRKPSRKKPEVQVNVNPSKEEGPTQDLETTDVDSSAAVAAVLTEEPVTAPLEEPPPAA